MRSFFFFVTLSLTGALAHAGTSVYPTQPEDKLAIVLKPGTFGARGDGVADDTAAIQAAIDAVKSPTGEGIVFVAEGRYRVARTIYVWPGIRVIGYGARRPVFALADNTPGYQQGIGLMFFFTGFRVGARAGFRFPEPPPGTVPPKQDVIDANSGTFYSAMINIDFEIGAGNPSAVGIRFHVAQHGYLTHMDFHTGSGLAALQEAGNEAEDLHFYGGRYGILMRKPSAAWQFTLIDSTFEGQREAAIRENEAGLTLVHVEFRNVPTAIAIDAHYSDQLWVKDSVFEQISGPAIVISNEHSRMTEVNVETSRCRSVATFAQLRESGKKFAGVGESYEVRTLSHGFTIPQIGGTGEIRTRYDAVPLKAGAAPIARAIRALPPSNEWTNLRTLGAVGDGKTDETALIQRAINEHAVLYVPMGRYVVSDTLRLRNDSVIIGLHPDQTQFDILDSTPAFQGPGAPKALLEAPRGSSPIVAGIGLYTGGINSRAVGAFWMADKNSLMNDVRFLGGHGTTGPNGSRENPYIANLASDPDPRRRWDSQYPSLWITHGGGGTFTNIWTPSTFAQNGLYISDTTTPGRVYELSSEHHVRTEVKLDHAENWELYSLQTEGEREESKNAISIEINHSKNITIANYHGYRVVRSYEPVPYAVKITDSTNIRFRNTHVDSNSAMARCDENGCRQQTRSNKVAFETCIYDATRRIDTRDREFAWLDITDAPVVAKTQGGAVTMEPQTKIVRLATGFYNISGATVDANGQLYFVDAHKQTIYRWDATAKMAKVVRDNPLEPVNLTFDNAGNLLVVSTLGKGMSMYTFRPDGPEDELTVLQPQPAAEQSAMRAALPVNYFVNGDFTNTLDVNTYEYISLRDRFTKVVTTRMPLQYISPDKTLFIPAEEAFIQGPPYFGYKFNYPLQAYGLVKSAPGKTFYVTNESEQRTYVGTVNTDGTLADVRIFAEQGGESLTEDRAGNVYLAAGDVFVYTAAGKLIDTIHVAERPIQILFGGKDRRTLYVLTQRSLYAARMRNAEL